MNELELWKQVAEDWKRRWVSITNKFNLHVAANKKIKIENDDLRADNKRLKKELKKYESMG